MTTQLLREACCSEGFGSIEEGFYLEHEAVTHSENPPSGYLDRGAAPFAAGDHTQRDQDPVLVDANDVLCLKDELVEALNEPPEILANSLIGSDGNFLHGSLGANLRSWNLNPRKANIPWEPYPGAAPPSAPRDATPVTRADAQAISAALVWLAEERTPSIRFGAVIAGRSSAIL